MGMTISRWAAAVGVVCASIAALLLPFPATASVAWTPASAASAALVAETNNLTQAAAAAQSAVRTYRVAQALDRWNSRRKGADTASVRVDATVPPQAAAIARTIVAEQWAALGSRASATHAEVFVYFDTSSIPRASNSGGRSRALEGRALVDVAFALPEATDGRRCVALVRLRGSSSAHIAALRSAPVLGVCGFFAAFGMPGDGVRAWLAGTSYRFARRSDWVLARAPAIDATSLYGLSGAGSRCLTGSGGGCLEALRVSDSNVPGQPPLQTQLRVIDPSSPTYGKAASMRNAELGSAEDALLADAVRAVGPDRFARFWTSPSGPDAAYLAATGVSLGSWTQQWLTRTYGAIGERPTPRARDVVWLTIAAPILLLVAARPRERVLTEGR